jgi:hypothetical protein
MPGAERLQLHEEEIDHEIGRANRIYRGTSVFHSSGAEWLRPKQSAQENHLGGDFSLGVQLDSLGCQGRKDL